MLQNFVLILVFFKLLVSSQNVYWPDVVEERNGPTHAVPMVSPWTVNDTIPVDLELVLAAMTKAVRFTLKSRKLINLDSLIGLRVIEGKLTGMLNNFGERMPFELKANFTRLRDLSYKVSQICAKTVQETTPYYYSNVGLLVDPYSWSQYYRPRKLEGSINWSIDFKLDTWKEKDCDDCLHELIPSTDEGRCSISEKCWKTVANTKLSGYSLAHQVIYLIYGERANCEADFNELASTYSQPSTTVPSLLNTYCLRMYEEANQIAGEGFPAEVRDLFMELVGICGYIGFYEFCKPEWFVHIISWQAESGCYHRFIDEQIDEMNFNPQAYGKSRRRRKKRSEALLSTGEESCLAHRTSVAMTTLTAYLNMFVENRFGSN